MRESTSVLTGEVPAKQAEGAAGRGVGLFHPPVFPHTPSSDSVRKSEDSARRFPQRRPRTRGIK